MAQRNYARGQHNIQFVWHFVNPTTGLPYDVSGFNLQLRYRCGRGETIADGVTYSGNTISWLFPKDEQHYAGTYSLRLLVYERTSSGEDGDVISDIEYRDIITLYGIPPRACSRVSGGEQNNEDITVNVYGVFDYALTSKTIATISDDGFWVIDGVKTSVSAKGVPGPKGDDGGIYTDGVRYDTVQNLTPQQKARARVNIGAVSDVVLKEDSETESIVVGGIATINLAEEADINNIFNINTNE